MFLIADKKNYTDLKKVGETATKGLYTLNNTDFSISDIFHFVDTEPNIYYILVNDTYYYINSFEGSYIELPTKMPDMANVKDKILFLVENPIHLIYPENPDKK
jgi:hypothetical protein